jgi:NAD(P)-dependent dehydrogenase (short-subunit alcohol dehydrogenase family)
MQTGKSVVITGANSGLGFQTSLAMAKKGARVIMACRNLEKGEEARLKVLECNPEVEPELWELDLSSLSSVQAFAELYLANNEGPDLLINNAGLMAIPYQLTADGFEMQFGVNYLGHFALTARLWHGMSNKTGARIVNVSSLAHRFGKIRFFDINWDQGYQKWGAYSMSKLSNLLFTLELADKLKESDSSVVVAAAHPGYADTSLQAKGMLMAGSKGKAGIFSMANRVIAQSGEMGALPSLYAATAPGVERGSFYGPSGLLRLKGWPSLEKPDSKRARPEVARRLWGVSEELTGIKFSVS